MLYSVGLRKMARIQFIPKGGVTDALYFVGSNVTQSVLQNTTTETTLATISIPAGKVKNGIVVMASCRSVTFAVDANPNYAFKIKAGLAGSEAEVAGNASRFDARDFEARMEMDGVSVVGHTTSPDWSVANDVIFTAKMDTANANIKIIFEDLVVMGY